AAEPHAADAELSLLRDVLRMLPSGVTVQDEHGNLLLINDTAAAQLGVSKSDLQSDLQSGPSVPPSRHLKQRRDCGLELLSQGRQAIIEECVDDGQTRQVLLTAHRPIRVADRNLLISSSADISEQKAFEDQLFRSAYYDELTDLPTRRVIEHRANSLLTRDDGATRFALAFLDIDNFKHINDYYGHSVGDTLLIEVAKRLTRDLRESDMLARISGDEFLLLLNPVQGAHEVEEFLRSTLRRLTAPFFIDGSEIFARPRSASASTRTMARAMTCCARTRISPCTASRTTAR